MQVMGIMFFGNKYQNKSRIETNARCGEICHRRPSLAVSTGRVEVEGWLLRPEVQDLAAGQHGLIEAVLIAGGSG